MFTTTTGTESTLLANAPFNAAPVVYDALWPDLIRQVQTILRRPTAIRKVAADALATVVQAVERAGGSAAVIAALDVDRRRCAAGIRGTYTAPIPDHDDGVALDAAQLVERLLQNTDSRTVRSATRDLVRRLDPDRRVAVLDNLCCSHRAQWSANTAIQEIAALAAAGEVCIDGAHLEAVRTVLHHQSGAIRKFSPTTVARAILDDNDAHAKTCAAIITTLWNGASLDLLGELAARWRSGSGGPVRRDLGYLLAVHGVLTDTELTEVAATMQSGAASLVLAQVSPREREVILAGLPEDVRLYDISGVLESLGGMHVDAVCNLVRRAGARDLRLWLAQSSTGSTLGVDLGTAVAATIVQHWRATDTQQLVNGLRETVFTTPRSDIEHLAVHAPDARTILAAGGTLGMVARDYLYSAFGDDRALWDYLRGMLPAWNGSVYQLCRAVQKMAKLR